MKLEVGKKYRLNNGEEHFCDEYSFDGFRINGKWYSTNGKIGKKY